MDQPEAISGISDASRARLVYWNGVRYQHGPADNAGYEPSDSTLTALAAFNTNGFLVQTAADTFAGRTLAAPAAGLTIANPAGAAGNPTFALANDLAGVEGLATTGIARRSATDTWDTITYLTGQTFTPTIIGNTSAGVGTYTTQTGSYTQIGNIVVFTAAVAWSAHTGTGTMRVGAGTLPSPIGQSIIFPAFTLGMTGATSPIVNWNGSQFNISNAESGAGIAMDTAALIVFSGSFLV